MELKIYNTLTRKKMEFKPLQGSRVGIYACGVTLYDKLHLGHARAAVVFDMIRNYLEFKGYEVVYVTNFTDVDDKMIQRANELDLTIFELAERFIYEYFEQMEKLGVRKSTHYPRATEHIEAIIEIIQKLEAKGIAYKKEGDVFFSIKRFSSYGKLSGQSLEELVAGARVEIDEKKEDPLDFALWKKIKDGEPAWDSPWGKGRPGWHIECSAMAMKYLGESIDLHGGGKDLIFPHHENEIAQSEAATGKKFANFWVHNGLVRIDGKKMAKSAKNFVTLSQILEKYEGEVARFYLLGAHYRSALEFREQSLDEALSSLARIYNALNRIAEVAPCDTVKFVRQNVPEKIEKIHAKFFQSMDDDFNTPAAFAAIFELAKEANLILQEPLVESSKYTLLLIGAKIRELGSILGFFQNRKQEDLNSKARSLLDILIEIRNKLRAEKKWDLADEIREELQKIEIQLDDEQGKTVWRLNGH